MAGKDKNVQLEKEQDMDSSSKNNQEIKIDLSELQKHIQFSIDASLSTMERRITTQLDQMHERLDSVESTRPSSSKPRPKRLVTSSTRPRVKFSFHDDESETSDERFKRIWEEAGRKAREEIRKEKEAKLKKEQVEIKEEPEEVESISKEGDISCPIQIEDPPIDDVSSEELPFQVDDLSEKLVVQEKHDFPTFDLEENLVLDEDASEDLPIQEEGLCKEMVNQEEVDQSEQDFHESYILEVESTLELQEFEEVHEIVNQKVEEESYILEMDEVLIHHVSPIFLLSYLQDFADSAGHRLFVLMFFIMRSHGVKANGMFMRLVFDPGGFVKLCFMKGHVILQQPARFEDKSFLRKGE